MSRLAFHTEVIHRDGDPNIPSLPNDMTALPTVVWSTPPGFAEYTANNIANAFIGVHIIAVLNAKVSRIISAYHSTAFLPSLTGKDWMHHKAACNMSAALHSGDTDTEAPLQRHLRHWTARFEISLLCAAIVGMNIHRDFSNIDKYGMIVRLSPRPHAITGARFSFESCSIIPIQEFKDILTGLGMGMILAQHERERALLKAKSKGEDDFAACVVIAANIGQWKLDGEHNTEVRFKPLAISKDRARSPQLNSPTLAWLESLKMQIERDFPSRPIVS